MKIAKDIRDDKVRVYMRGYTDGAGGKPGKMPKAHPTYYERGYYAGQARRQEAEREEKTRLGLPT